MGGYYISVCCLELSTNIWDKMNVDLNNRAGDGQVEIDRPRLITIADYQLQERQHTPTHVA